MRVFILLVLLTMELFLFCNNVFAEEIKILNNVVTSRNVISIESNTKNENIKIRVLDEDGEILSASFIDKNNKEISQYKGWTDLPPLKDIKQIKFHNIHNSNKESINIFFDIYNMEQEELIRSEKIKLWVGPIQKDYITKLNQNLNSLQTNKEVLKNDSVQKNYEKPTNNTNNKNKINLLFFCIISFLIGILLAKPKQYQV